MFDYIFAVRPSTFCNMNCSYCVGSDDLHSKYRPNEFNIDSMVLHSDRFPKNLVSFCGYGETMLHPQFADMIITLSKTTNVEWITNGTLFNTPKFTRILEDSINSHIHGINVSVHFGQIETASYFDKLRPVIHKVRILGIPIHLTSIVTDSNINDIIANIHYINEFGITLKSEFTGYIRSGKSVNNPISPSTQNALRFNNLSLTYDAQPVVQYPYKGNRCPNGYRIFEVMHDGEIFDCSYDENRIVIGNINDEAPIQALDASRICKSDCNFCCDTVRGGYSFNLQKPNNFHLS